MKIPYGYVLVNEEIIVQEEKADVVRSVFEYYLAGASLGKVVDMLYAKDIPSPSGNLKWGRATIDKLLSNAKYIPSPLCFPRLPAGGGDRACPRSCSASHGFLP